MKKNLLKSMLWGWILVCLPLFVGCAADDDVVQTDSGAMQDEGIIPQSDGSIAPQPGRAVGTMNVSEGTYLGQQSAKVGASFKIAVPACGEVQTFGQCSIRTNSKPTCTPACTAEQVCAWKADCLASECIDSVPMQAGEITITGATHQAPMTCTFLTTQTPPGYKCDVNAEQDVFDSGDPLHIVAAGGSFAAFDLEVKAPPEHSITTDTDSWTAATFDGSADVPLQWDTTETADEFKMTLKGKSGDLVCRFDDTGSFNIPREGLTAIGGVVQVDIHRQNKLVVNEGADGEMTILAVNGLALAIEGACYSCKQYSQACQTSDCPEMNVVCSGAPRDAATDLDDCLCAQCATECALMCSGSGSDTGCLVCKQGAMKEECSAQRATCMSN